MCVCMEYYSAIRKNEIMPICSNMDVPKEYHVLSKVSQRQKSYKHYFHIESKILKDTNDLISKKKETHKESKQTYDCQMGEGVVKRIYWEVGLTDTNAQLCPTLCDPVDQAPQSMGFSRQEYFLLQDIHTLYKTGSRQEPTV